MKKRANGNHGDLIKNYREELLNKKAELLASLGINAKRVADAEHSSEEDLITVSKDELLHLGLNRVLYGQLREVKSALDMLALGGYGTCAECNSPIPSKRLQAVPWATYCVNCQDKAAVGNAPEFRSLAMEY